MADRDVNVDFNVNGAAYASSLQQMIAVTGQYNKVADTMIGKVAKFSGAITSTMITKTAGLTQANKMATAQAAAYQQKMSNLQATAAVVGEKTFPKLEKATLKMAREFPIGIGQAVEQMESLQESGVTSVDTMTKLANTYTKLGAATGTYAPVIGKAMTEFTRGMGNNLSMTEGFGDTLVSLTKKYGGSAEGVLAFSKSIAPIASTIGMNQAQVMGLSEAFSRSGEDGFAAGNAINKVMIDLNKAARDGGPELRMYASAMNKSVGQLQEQLNEDPASVIVDFTEAVQKQGPNAIRMLESLGIEGVRTVKAFTTLSREGNLGEIVDEAGKAYGSGSTQTAAQEALSGVNDQMATLQESTSQMIAAAGKPFLSWLEMVLKAANGVSGAFASIAQSGLMQNVAKVGAVVSTGGSLAMTVVSAASTYALLRRGGRALSGAAERFGTGLAAGRGTAPLTGDGPMGPMTTRLGAAYGYLTQEGAAERAARQAARQTSRLGIGGRTAFQAARAGGQGLWSAATMAVNMTANDIRTGMGKAPWRTEGGALAQSGFAAAGAHFKAGDAVAGVKKFGETMKLAAAGATDGSKAFGSMTKAMANLTTATALAGADLATRGAKTAWGGIGGVAGALGIGAPMLAVGGVAAGVWGASKVSENQKSDEVAMQATNTDPYRAFNDFAVKAGYATEQVSLLGKAAGQAAKEIADQNDSDKEAYKLSSQEAATAGAPGYEAAWTTSTGNSVDDAIRAYMENPNQSASEVARRGMDVTAQHGAEKGQAFLTEYEALKKQEAEGTLTPTAVAQKGINAQEAAQGMFGWENDTSRAQASATAGYYNQRWNETGEKNSPEAGRRQKEQDLESLYAASLKAPKGQQEEYTALISSLSGLDKQALSFEIAGGGKNWGEVLDQLATGKGSSADAASGLRDEARARAAGTALPEGGNQARKDSENSTKVYQAVADTNVDLTKALWAGKDLAEDQNKNLKELNDTDLKSLTLNQKQIAAAQQKPGDLQAQNAAARALIDEAMKGAKDDVGKAQGALTSQLAVASTPEDKAMLGKAISGFASSPQFLAATRGQSTMQRLGTTIDAGRTAAMTPLPEGADEGAVAANEATIQAGVGAMEQAQDMQKQYLQQVRSTMIAYQRANEDSNRSIARANDDFQRQQRYAAEDFHHQMALSKKQFHTQMARAEEDYNKQVSRSTRDFNISMARNQQAFNRNFQRTMADHHKQLERQVEDNAKAMYDPYQRVNYKRVWDAKQLVANLAEQNELLAKQSSAVDQIKKLGLNQSAVDMLGLADPENAQQTLKILSDIMNDPSLVAQMNKQVAGRVDLSKAFTTDKDNVSYRRSEEDFKTSMGRMKEDYNIGVKEAKADFKKGLKDMAADYATSKKRAREDYNLQMKEMRRQFRIANERAAEQQATNIARMRADAKTARDRMIKDLETAGTQLFETLEEAEDDTGKYLAKLPERQRSKITTAMGGLAKFIKDHKWPEPHMTVIIDYETGKVETPTVPVPKTVNVHEGGGGPAGSSAGGGSSDLADFFLNRIGDSRIVGKSAGGQLSMHDVAQRCLQNAAWAKRYVGGTVRHSGYPTAFSVGRAIKTEGQMHKGYDAPAGALYWWNGGIGAGSGHVAISDGKGNAINNWGGTKIERNKVSSMSSRAYMGWSKYAALGQGGITTKETKAFIGEGGTAEAIIPLNSRGAKLLLDVMQRYVSSGDAKTSRVAPHSSMVINNSTLRSDNSTNFTGPISVEASDPVELARQLRQVTRGKRLSQPMAGH